MTMLEKKPDLMVSTEVDMLKKKLIAVRVNPNKYDCIMKYLQMEKEKSLNPYTFADIVDDAMDEFLKKHNIE